MSLTLRADDMARFEAVSRVLLAPLAAPSLDAWRSEVNRALRLLMGVDHTMFAMPLEQGLDFFSEELEGVALEGFREYVREASPGALRSPDPALDLWFSRRRQLGLGAYDEYSMDRLTDGAYRHSSSYQELVVRGRMFDHMGLSADLPQGEAFICLAHEQPGKAAFGEERLLLLRLLQPVFRAGVEAWSRLEAQRKALAEALDALDEALLVCDFNGREQHRNRALRDMLAAEPEADVILAEMRFAARQLGPLGRGGSIAPPTASSFAVRELATQSARYRLRSSFASPDLMGPDGAMLLAIERLKPAPMSPALPPPELLQERYGLTKREAEVALLLAEGLANDAIAERLFISTHTARRHTERVLEKMDLNSRKALALKLIQEFGVPEMLT